MERDGMVTWQELDVDVDGVSIHVRRAGDPTRPSVVLAHGFTDSGACWRHTAEALDHDVIAPDARHHGRSASPDDTDDQPDDQPDDQTDEVDDLVGVITRLGLSPVRLVGHSMGARTAAEVAARRPDLVERLVLEDPPWRAEDEHEAGEIELGDVRAHLRRLATMSGDELARMAADQHGDWPADEHPDWIESKQQVREGAARLLTTRPWGPVVDALRCPTLLICGEPERGAITPPEVADAVRRRNELIEVVTIPGAGHNIRREQRAAFLEVVRRFLAG